MPKARGDNTVGQRIQQRRTELGLSQQDLAEKLNLSYQQVQNYESGSSEITVTRLQEIAFYLRTPLDFFLKGVQPPESIRIREKRQSRETQKEKQLLTLYRKLEDPSAQAAVLKMIKAFDQQLDKRRSKSRLKKRGR